MDQTFHTRSYFNECTVVGHYHYVAFNFVTNFEVGIKCIPRMRHELFEAKGDTLLLIVKVKDNDIELLIELYHFFGVAYAAP